MEDAKDAGNRQGWRIHLLGSLRAVRGDETVTRFRSQKTAELLAYLAYFRQRCHPREILVELLWPEYDLDAGRHSLSVALSSLRHQLEPPGSAAGSVLQADRFSVRLHPQTATDVADLEATLEQAARAPDATARVSCLARVLSLYTGELLPGHYEDWLIPEQQRLDELFFQAVRQLIAHLEHSGDYAGALQYALRAVATNRLREEAHREVIRLYSAAGQPDAALRQYRELERILNQELDTRPGAATRDLVRRIQDGDVEAAQIGSEPSNLAVTVPAGGAGLLRHLAGDLEPVGGGVPPGSRYYIERVADDDFELSTTRGDSILLVKGPRQVGKSSLLARGLHRAAGAGDARVALTHFQLFNAAHLETADALLFAMAQSLADQLDLEVLPEEDWDPRRGPNPNFRRYLRREVLPRLDAPLIWALDEVDRLFGCAFSGEIFGLFRSWHDERAVEPGGPWSRLTLVIAYSTEAHLFITDLNQSPFNVGTRLTLEDFTREQVAELNRRHGEPLRDEGEIDRYYALVKGHPYLVRQGLYEMRARGGDIDFLEAASCRDEGLYGPHLRRILYLLTRDSSLAGAVREVLRGGPCPTSESFYRLRSAGVLSGDSRNSPEIRCGLYERYLKQHLQ